ncbi:hypothetical protein L211DRAFT_845780 [Terfezia boudieri ATCC MYA-4762]|uniref:Uncharacterized protein n=1 Tax=Terfezia boudieri ATCC MYA-4762 TaxID=1051890 RepID=A0A3N4M487_9PEZI|nr:hypothetical protein L211DRAFT_845780 [Terfezia boudieri ATCC MYA-4762]
MALLQSLTLALRECRRVNSRVAASTIEVPTPALGGQRGTAPPLATNPTARSTRAVQQANDPAYMRQGQYLLFTHLPRWTYRGRECEKLPASSPNGAGEVWTNSDKEPRKCA